MRTRLAGNMVVIAISELRSLHRVSLVTRRVVILSEVKDLNCRGNSTSTRNKIQRRERGATTYALRSTICVISGGAPRRTGAPTVPIPRFTYNAESPLGALGINLIVSPRRFGWSGIDSGR